MTPVGQGWRRVVPGQPIRSCAEDRSAERRPRPDGTGISVVLGLCGTGTTVAREDGRLADPSDLLDGATHAALVDDDGAPDPEKVKGAVSELLARKPHYAKRISGDVGQGARPGPADPNEELWGSIQSRTR